MNELRWVSRELGILTHIYQLFTIAIWINYLLGDRYLYHLTDIYKYCDEEKSNQVGKVTAIKLSIIYHLIFILSAQMFKFVTRFGTRAITPFFPTGGCFQVLLISNKTIYKPLGWWHLRIQESIKEYKGLYSNSSEW